jgi:hypothetical protein
MRLITAAGSLFALLLVCLCLAPGSWSQQAASAGKPSAVVKVKNAALAKSSPSASDAVLGEPSGGQNILASAERIGKRDPFAALINNQRDAGAGIHLPPGKAGLVIATVRVDGTVRSGVGMIAIVSNPGNSVYFIREGDRLYDGTVEKIGLDGVTFREDSKDAFGHPIERTVTKRIYAIAGEEQ